MAEETEKNLEYLSVVCLVVYWAAVMVELLDSSLAVLMVVATVYGLDFG